MNLGVCFTLNKVVYISKFVSKKCKFCHKVYSNARRMYRALLINVNRGDSSKDERSSFDYLSMALSQTLLIPFFFQRSLV